MDDKKAGWKSLPKCDVLAGASALDCKTGNWRSRKPRWIAEKCINCFICWMACPDNAVQTTPEGKFGEFKYDYCKGCGICAHECPKDAIEMVPEK